MKIKFTFLIFFWLLATSGHLKSQMAVLASGGDATGNGSSSYSVGQIAYLHKGSNAEVMEGVQTSFEVTALSTNETGIQKENGILLYPNPFKDFLYLDFKSNSYRDSNYQLFDAQGKLIKQDKINQSKSELNFSDLPSAMYIMKIRQEGRDIKTFKIIKK
jgi:hypothetical protein